MVFGSAFFPSYVQNKEENYSVSNLKPNIENVDLFPDFSGDELKEIRFIEAQGNRHFICMNFNNHPVAYCYSVIKSGKNSYRTVPDFILAPDGKKVRVYDHHGDEMNLNEEEKSKKETA